MKRNVLIEPEKLMFFKKPLSINSCVNDSDLMLRISNDDIKAFQLLYDKYWDVLFLHACSKLPSSAAAEYIIEDLFLRIWDNRIQFCSRIPTDVFLFKELKKAILKHYSDVYFK